MRTWGDDFRDVYVYTPCQQNVVTKDSAGEERRTYQIVISSATMISSFRINAVNKIATMFKNSFSKVSKAKGLRSGMRRPKKGG